MSDVMKRRRSAVLESIRDGHQQRMRSEGPAASARREEADMSQIAERCVSKLSIKHLRNEAGYLLVIETTGELSQQLSHTTSEFVISTRPNFALERDARLGHSGREPANHQRIPVVDEL